MKIAIIGAGPSGLATAAVLQEFGHDVVLFEKAPDIGGVWSSTRAYPGVATQDDRVTYAFSDVPMPDDFPVHPSGAHVRAYLEDYARRKGLQDRIHLSTCVRSAEPNGTRGWVITVAGPDGEASYDLDWLVVANGVFSTPHEPDWPGREEFVSHGGRVIVPSRLGTGADLNQRRVVVVGWGKTACDVAAESSRVALSTTVVARTIRWKVPKRIAGGLTFRHLLLTRLGEHMMTAPRASFRERVVTLLGLPARRCALWLLRRIIAGRAGLRALGMMPALPLPYSDSLVSEGFFEAMASGRLQVRRERSVQRLATGEDGSPGVVLSDGSWLAADILVAATGFEQDLSFFGPSVKAALRNDDGVLGLHRRILPPDVPRLAFAGWGHTYRSPLTAEVGAIWLAGHLAGVVPQPTREEMWRSADRYHLTHAQAAARGEPQLPNGSFAALDSLLDDLELPLPPRVRRRQWLVPLDPASYAYLRPALRWRLSSAGDVVSGTALPGHRTAVDATVGATGQLSQRRDADRREGAPSAAGRR